MNSVSFCPHTSAWKNCSQPGIHFKFWIHMFKFYENCLSEPIEWSSSCCIFVLFNVFIYHTSFVKILFVTLTFLLSVVIENFERNVNGIRCQDSSQNRGGLNLLLIFSFSIDTRHKITRMQFSVFLFLFLLYNDNFCQCYVLR